MSEPGLSSPEPLVRPGADALALFNPAFLGGLIGRAASGHRTERDSPMPLALGYLVAPIVLHPATRDALPRVNARLAKWADDRQLLRAELRWRAPQLAGVTRRALRFGLRHELIVLTAGGIDPADGLGRVPEPDDGDAAECWKKAEFLGRWLPRAGPPTTVLALLGMRP